MSLRSGHPVHLPLTKVLEVTYGLLPAIICRFHHDLALSVPALSWLRRVPQLGPTGTHDDIHDAFSVCKSSHEMLPVDFATAHK